MKHYIGIDISADEFHYCISSADKGNKIESSCENNPIAIARFIKKNIRPNDVCIMESTGVYHHELAFALDEAGIRQYVVNQKRSVIIDLFLAELLKRIGKMLKF